MPRLIDTEACLLTLADSSHPLGDLEDCAIAVDATYYLQLQLNTHAPEPLLTALGGLTGIRGCIEADLDQWKSHRMTPFFIFDGQSITGQDEASTKKSLLANRKTDYAWDLYFESQALEAVVAFGVNSGMLTRSGSYWGLPG